MKAKISLLLLLISNTLLGQWNTNGNIAAPNFFLGTTNAQHLKIRTANIERAWFTTGNILSGVTGSPGDGLQIKPKTIGCSNPSTNTASLDLWTSCSSGAHIRWANSGEIGGTNNRFEQWANYDGFWFNANGGGAYQPRYIFNTGGTEHARAGLNRFWRIGDNPSNVDATRRLEVFQAGNDPQLRLTASSTATTFTDFRARNNGNLNILPSGGQVAINTNANPTHTLSINGDCRIFNVPVATPNCLLVGTNQSGATDNQISRLDFTGNANQVLLGNGTWGNAAASLFANNGATIINISGQDHVQWGQVNTGVGTLAGGELLHDTEIPFNGFNVLFQDPLVSNPSQNRMQVGPYIGATTYNDLAKFSAIHGENSTNLNRVGGFFSTTVSFNPNTVPLQLRPLYFGGIVPVSAGILSIANDLNGVATMKVGVEGGAYGGSTQKNIGISGKAYGSDIANYGLLGISSGINNSMNYGIYTTSSGGVYSVAAFFDGDIDGVGTYNYASDINLKQNINNITNADSILQLLEPVSFEFKTTSYPQMHFSNGTKYGLIAQNVETVLPAIVKNSVFPAQYDSLGNVTHPEVNYKSLNYESIIPFLIKGHKEQTEIINEKDSLINSLQDQINTLYGMITACCSNNSNMGNAIQNQNTNHTLDVTLNDAPSIVLDQNVPNPFAEQTTITYSLLDGVQKAQMLFYNVEGKLIQSINLTPTGGKGQINVFANDLSTGIYTYTLIVDGEIKGTKRMVKE